jgi:DNA-directed RNA polymerase subunit RPC12/RpoP
MSVGKTLGGCLIGAGVLWLVGWTGLFVAGYAGAEIDLPVTIMGSLIFAVPVGVGLMIGGAVALAVAKRRREDEEDAQFEARVQSMIETAGSVTVPEIASELGVSTQKVREAIYDLVARQRFTGYVNWDQQRVYSVVIGRMPTDRCPNCGGELELAGKDTVVCPYCRNEIFLSQTPPQREEA